MKRSHKIVAVVLSVLVVIFAVRHFTRGSSDSSYRTVQIERGNIVQTVRATGTVEPIKLVEVGTQVNGPVSKLYVDFNDEVKEGDLVAQIDPTVYDAQLQQAQADQLQHLAAIDEAKAKLEQSEKVLARSQELAKRDMVSQEDLDAAVADRDTLAAELKVAEAVEEQGKASLRLAQANLDYTKIRSPVNGVVIARNVSEGQTVVASFSAQVLFLIATDLKKIQVEASIPEADIGKIRVDQPVTFTVDAYDQEFKGIVSQVRLAATTVQNVVTYPVIITAANPDGKLFPSMTANISCEVARETDVLKVPNSALRYKPATGDRAPSGMVQGAPGEHRGPKLWILEKPLAQPSPVPVKLGITDGTFTEIKNGDDFQSGEDVVIGVAENGDANASGPVNPFTPKFPGGGAKRH